jgi:chromosome segregation ATPase
MNDKNDDLNKTNHHSPLASDNDDGKLIIKDEILKINNLIKNKFHLPKLDQNIKDKFLDIKKSTFELKNNFQDQSLKISSLIKKEENQIYNLSEKNNIQLEIFENQKQLIETYKNNKNQLQSYTLELEKKLTEQKSSNRSFLVNNTELKSTLSRFIKHNKNLQKDISRLKHIESDSLMYKSRSEEMSNQIKFYQEDNIRLSNEIINIQKKYEMIKSNLASSEKVKEDIFKQINDLNNSLTKTNIVGTPFVKKIVEEESINSKILNDIKNKNLKDEKIKSEKNTDLDEEINDIFK